MYKKNSHLAHKADISYFSGVHNNYKWKIAQNYETIISLLIVCYF